MDLIVRHGCSADYTITATDDANPLDLTSATLTFVATPADVGSVITKTSPSSGIVPGPSLTPALATNQARLSFVPADTASLANASTRFSWTLTATFPGGAAYPLNSGGMVVKPW